MPSKLNAAAGALAETTVAAALVAVPFFFNLHSERIFEEDKIPLLRSLAVITLVALLIWWGEGGRSEGRRNEGPVWRLPLVKPALLVVAAYGLATLCSVAPWTSFWGGYTRMHGAYSQGAYVILFAAIVLLFRTREQIDRLVTVAILASVAPVVYGLIQHLDRDPVKWGSDVAQRIHAGAGNAIFYGAFMIMVVPLTLARVIATPREVATHRLAAAVRGAGYLGLLACQLLAIVFAQSRGPIIGLAVGLMSFFLLLASERRARSLTIAVTVAAAAGAVFLITLNLPRSPLAALRATQYFGRLSRVFETETGTGRVRTLIWEGATEMLAANPARALLGYGPETMYVAYPPYYPTDLAYYESRQKLPDRAHNETFDALLTTGAIGLAAQLTLLLAVCVCVLCQLGILRTSAQRRAWLAVTLAGGMVGALLPYAIERSWRFVGIGLPAGIIGGVFLYLIVYAIRQREPAPPRNHFHLVLIALLAAVLGHFAESQLGIAVAPTRLYFWTFAALAVAIRFAQMPDGDDAEAASTTALNLGVAVGLLLIVVTFDFYTDRVARSPNLGVTAWLFASVWLFGAMHCADRWRAVAYYAAISVAVWLPFAVLYRWWIDSKPLGIGALTLDQMRAVAMQEANLVTVLYVAGCLVLSLSVVVALWRAPHAAPFARRPAWLAIAYPVFLAVAVGVVARTNLDVTRADVLAKQADYFDRKTKLAAARWMYEEALRLQPHQDRYGLKLAHVLRAQALKASKAQQALQRDTALAQAIAVLERARATNPLDADHLRNLGRMHRAWADAVDEPNVKQRHREIADGFYEQAVTLNPRSATLWDEWALLSITRRDLDKALTALERSLEIDGNYATTSRMRGDIFLDKGLLEQSLADYDRAADLDPESTDALSSKALVLARLGRTAEAIDVNQQVLAIRPRDMTSHRNLAVLYDQMGELTLALAEAEAALALAKNNDKQPLEEFIATVRAKLAGTSP
ncbi:MAG: O-antigen ligase family protein [Deltaproteobacteria bacterium]|nr:O-antigen ligase family protein [Deltaproteobacteria bacterium]MBI3387975.1 O-antigen ligase family protein [Deltaproteobacteria bacterium]